MSAAERVYRLLLRAYPPGFREAYGGEMALLFRDRRREADAGAVRFWAETLWDVVRSAPPLRLEAARWRWREPGATEGEMTTMAILAILVGALEMVGGLQEMWYGGMLDRESYPLIAGTLGWVAGALLVAAGIALLRRTPRAPELARAAALTCLPVFVLIGVVEPLMGYLATVLGIGFPLVLLGYLRWGGGRGPRPAASAG